LTFKIAMVYDGVVLCGYSFLIPNKIQKKEEVI